MSKAKVLNAVRQQMVLQGISPEQIDQVLGPVATTRRRDTLKWRIYITAEQEALIREALPGVKLERGRKKEPVTE